MADCADIRYQNVMREEPASMAGRAWLKHPAARVVRLALNVCLGCAFIWLIWSGWHEGALGSLIVILALRFLMEGARSDTVR